MRRALVAVIVQGAGLFLVNVGVFCGVSRWVSSRWD
jgi:hypothetical protein